MRSFTFMLKRILGSFCNQYMFIYLGLDLIGMSEEYLPLKVEIATFMGMKLGNTR